MTEYAVPVPGRHAAVFGLSSRLAVLCGVLAVECLAIAKLSRPWLATHEIMAAPIVFCTALLLFSRTALQAAGLDDEPVRKSFALLHVLAMAACAAAIHTLHILPSTNGVTGHLAAALWTASVAALVVSLVAAFFPVRELFHTLMRLGAVWFYAAICTVAAMAVRPATYWMWSAPQSALGHAMQVSTFAGVKALLNLFYPNVIAQSDIFALGTPRFEVLISGMCSGIEGMALMLIFCVGWLIYARKELRLERAVWLTPAALAAMWLMNLLRLAALIALGDAGHADIAMTGFHSEAGWIVFNAVALLFLLAAHWLRWVHRIRQAAEPTIVTERTVAARYLFPFLAMLLAAMLGRLVSSGFDAAYPLRLLFVVPVLWHFRAEYRRMDWRFGWPGPLTGVAVFLLWLGLARWSHVGDGDLLHAQLPTLTSLQRAAWITVRVLCTVLIVPFAEELAFRGYLARRVLSDDVEAVSFRRINALGIAVSAVAFGAMHGRMWLGGVLAGVAFAVIAKWRNRLGEAFAGHLTANLLITAWVVVSGNYGMW